MNNGFIGTKEHFKQMGARIKAIRISKGLTQKDVANKIDITLKHYEKIEEGDGSLSIPAFTKICLILGSDMNEIIYGESSHSSDFINLSEFSELKEYDQETIKEVINILADRFRRKNEKQ
ncbi:helix-turn-helix domain-containing protein [Caproicibacter sp. BJN0012]|uniref:helix-turn-helix domain-containing protein n=1 Tax=Caproicibacter sp. BJN0012 TaxID=3110227 RepID=UPI002E0F26B2